MPATMRETGGFSWRKQAANASAPPAFRDPWLVLLVAAGGAVGTGARVAIGQLFTSSTPSWIVVLVIDLTGALLLGLLLEILRSGTRESTSRRLIRLGVGTGVLGGYTTYSAFIVGADGLIADDSFGFGIAFTALTVLAGIVMARVGRTVVRSLRPEARR